MQKEIDIWKFYAATPKKVKMSSWRGDEADYFLL